MTYSITTQDGITIQNIPDDVDPNSQSLKDRVAEMRASQGKPSAPQSTPASAPLSAGDVATGAIMNFPSSVGSMVGDIYQAVTSPVQTAKTVLDLGAGALQNILPERLVQAIGGDKHSQEVATKVGQHYVNRYGGVENVKQTIAKDPAGVLADISSVLSLGALAPTRASTSLSAAARAIDPLMVTAKVGGKVVGGVGSAAKHVLGVQAGVGSEAIEQAYKAGRAGGEAAELLKANMRGTVPQTDVLGVAKQNLLDMAAARQTAYREGMKNITSDKAILSFSGVDDAVKRAFDRVTFKGQVKDDVAFAALEKAQNKVNDWKQLDPSEYHTPEGLDALKQQIGGILETIPYEQKTALGSVGDIYGGIKAEINKQAPTYAKTMKAYSEATETIREIEKALSFGKKATADTQMRKLQSIMRNNVNTNWGQRTSLVKELEESGGRQIMPALAGQALSEWTPRGLQRATAAPEAYLAHAAGGIPLAGVSLATSSPRLVGEAAYALGRTQKGLLDAQSMMPELNYAQMFNLLYQSQQPKGQED